MELVYMLVVPFMIGVFAGVCYKKYDNRLKRLEKEIEDAFNKGR